MFKKIIALVVILPWLLVGIGLSRGQLDTDGLNAMAAHLVRVAAATAIEMSPLTWEDVDRNLRAFEFENQADDDPSVLLPRAIPKGDCDDFTAWALALLWACPLADIQTLGFIVIDPDNNGPGHIAPVVYDTASGVRVIEYRGARDYTMLPLNQYLACLRRAWGPFEYRVWYIRFGTGQQPPLRKMISRSGFSGRDV